MAAADLDTMASIHQQGVQNLGQIYKALLGGFSNFVPVPATATSPGAPNQVALSATHLYLCIATDTWRRVAISAF
jgi:hypothetical protein